MDPFQRRKLGRSDVMVPQFGFGGAPLGDLFVKMSEADSEETLSAAWDAGVRYYDTAPWYGRGQSEHRMGRFLYRQPRKDFLISTKVGRILRAPANPDTFDRGMWAGGLSFDVKWDYSYDGIMRAYEDSIQRLGLNRIDILIIHDLDWWHHKTDALVGAYLNQLGLTPNAIAFATGEQPEGMQWMTFADAEYAGKGDVGIDGADGMPRLRPGNMAEKPGSGRARREGLVARRRDLDERDNPILIGVRLLVEFVTARAKAS